MRDIWGFLLQTLTASGVAVLLLVVKALFQDKLSPRWQSSVWGLLALVLLLPAGAAGRYVLLDWPVFVEYAKTALSGQYTLTRVTAPIPLPAAVMPKTLWDWMFWLYLAGVVVMLLRYVWTYLRLRMVLRNGQGAGAANLEKLRDVARRYDLPFCKAVEVEGLQSAFVCGLFSPVLALPAGTEVEEKVLLHELLHLKHRDVWWGVAICLLRCLHWCNPLLWYCADRAGNDLEALCDQRVLERLEGEERRDYGRILLSMASDRYPRVPGTSSMANGGKNISRRIQSIARFKRYPAGMALVSVCVAVVLAVPLVVGVKADGVYNQEGRLADGADIDLTLASARTVWCTTPAGALDTYGKALLEQRGAYRAMCAPLELYGEMAAEMKWNQSHNRWPTWEPGLPDWPDKEEGYCVYNLEQVEKDVYRALMTVKVLGDESGEPAPKGRDYAAVQNVQVEQEGGRWVVIPQEDFRLLQVDDDGLRFGHRELPAYLYTDTVGNFRTEITLQKCFVVDNTVEVDNGWFFGTTASFDTIPKPDAQFDLVYWDALARVTYLGSVEEKKAITRLGVSCAPADQDGQRPDLTVPAGPDGGGGSSTGEMWGSTSLEGDWGPEVLTHGGGSTTGFGKNSMMLPPFYAVDLYVNGEKTHQLTLYLQEGGAQ